MEIERKEGKRGRKEEKRKKERKKETKKETKKENQLSSDRLRSVLLGQTMKVD